MGCPSIVRLWVGLSAPPICKLPAQPEASIKVARGRPFATLGEWPRGTGGKPHRRCYVITSEIRDPCVVAEDLFLVPLNTLGIVLTDGCTL